ARISAERGQRQGLAEATQVYEITLTDGVPGRGRNHSMDMDSSLAPSHHNIALHIATNRHPALPGRGGASALGNGASPLELCRGPSASRHRGPHCPCCSGLSASYILKKTSQVLAHLALKINLATIGPP